MLHAQCLPIRESRTVQGIHAVAARDRTRDFRRPHYVTEEPSQGVIQ